MATLSKNEAKDIVKRMLPVIKSGIKDNGRAIVAIGQLERIFDPLTREGNTPDVYCKISEAAFDNGIATDLITTRDYGMAIAFNFAKTNYKNPSPKLCKKRWEDENTLGNIIQFAGSKDLIENL